MDKGERASYSKSPKAGEHRPCSGTENSRRESKKNRAGERKGRRERDRETERMCGMCTEEAGNQVETSCDRHIEKGLAMI